jgi:hypothetical protein
MPLRHIRSGGIDPLEDFRKELKIQSVQNKIHEHKQKWRRHLDKMTDGTIRK